MIKLRSLPLFVLASACLFSVTAQGQAVAPTVRIVNRIDESRLVTLKGNTPLYAKAQFDRGQVADSMPMNGLVLVLSRSPQQQAAFDAYVAGEYDSNSPNYHQWLTPAQVGEDFGPSQTDILTISNWLTGHGFSVSEISKDRMTMRFNGTAGQVQNAFHTQIHHLLVRGVEHIGNMSDPQIPEALAPVVVGIKALHNFTPRPAHRMGQLVERDAATGRWKRVANTAGATKSTRPQFATTDQYGDYIEDVGPWDFAAIYNVTPLWNAQTPIDGTGQTIAIAGTSDINLADVAAFRQDFDLPTSGAANTPQQMKGVNGHDPGMCTASSSSTSLCTIGDLEENTLDVEWSGAVARNAQIILVTSGYNDPTNPTNDPVYDSSQYVVNNKIAPVLNVSYGLCELGEGTAGNVSYHNLWQTAASEGIAVFVAAGDSGAAACDQGLDTNLPYAAQYGLTTSGLATSPYDTAVGGTDLYWCPISASSCATSAAQYWNTTNDTTTNANAKGYVPEVPWNDTCASPFGFQLTQEIANYLGVTGVNDAETGCNFAADPNYEQQVYNYLSYDMSYLVDIVGGSGGQSNCVANSSTATTTGTCSSGATGTGSANGNLTLVNDGWPKPTWQAGVPGIQSDGVRDIPDVSFFAADGFLGSSYLICVTESGSSCTYSSKSAPLAQEVGGTSVATPAMAGVMALINQKTGAAQGSPNVELYALAAKQGSNPGYASCSAEKATVSDNCYFNDIDAGPFTPANNNATPCAAGSPNCNVIHTGDSTGILNGWTAGTGYDLATGLGSLNVANVVNNWTSSIGTQTATVAVAPGSTTIAVSQSLSVPVTVSGSNGTPTGTVTLSGDGYTSPAEQLTNGTYTFTIPAYSLSGGSQTLTVSYSGDSTYAPASGSGTVTVTKITTTVLANPSATAINSNQTLTVTGTVTGTGVPPTGTVYITDGSFTSSAVTLQNGSYSITITPNSITTPGLNTLTVNYSGDASYNAATGTTSVTVTYVPVLNPTVAVTPASSNVNSGSPLMVTVTVTGSGATPTGTVTLSGSGYTAPAQTLSNGSTTFNIPANTLNSSPTAVVSDVLIATYAGDASYAQAIGSATVKVTQSSYALSASAPAPVSPGSTTSTTISASSPTDFTGTLTFTNSSCVLTNAPAGAVSAPSCALNGNGTMTFTNGVPSGTVSYTISTTSTTSASAADRPQTGWTKKPLEMAAAPRPAGPTSNPGQTPWYAAAGGSIFAAFLVFLVPGTPRKWRKMLSLVLFVASLSFMIAGCGSGLGTGSTGTPTQGTPTVSVTVNPSSITLGDKSTTVAVKVSVSGSMGTPTGSVSFSGGGYTSQSVTLSSGSYTFNVPASSFTTVGSDTLTASYSGDTNYAAASGTATLTVNNQPTTAGNYTFTVTPTNSAYPTAPQPSTTFTVTVN
jgi:hypothetical protein